MEYARSLIKRHGADEHVDDDGEETTIRNHDNFSPSSMSGYSSAGSLRGAPSEDWSVISDQDDKRSSVGSRHSVGHARGKRASLAAAVMSILPDNLGTGPAHQSSAS